VKNNILNVMKKEFSRFFRDRRMVIMILLPAVLIYVVYSFMGTAMSSMFAQDEDYKPVAYAVNIPDTITSMLQYAGITVSYVEPNETGELKERITKGEADLLIVFPTDFLTKIEAYDAQTATGPAPNIEIYHNSTNTNSYGAFQTVNAVLDVFEASLANKFDINRDLPDADLATAEDLSASIISSLMPMLLMVFLYSGCAGLAPESIAGEKERGTLATLLVTPLKRSQLAIGKILSLGVLSFLSGLITAVATILALPNMMGAAADQITVNIYGPLDYLSLALVILSTILLLVTVISIISAFAKTVKEANSAVMPLMIVVFLVGVTGMFGGGAQTGPIYYLIPLYNSVQCMSGVFALDYSVMNIVISCVSTIVYACVGGFVLTKMFNSEKIMFSR